MYASRYLKCNNANKNAHPQKIYNEYICTLCRKITQQARKTETGRFSQEDKTPVSCHLADDDLLLLKNCYIWAVDVSSDVSETQFYIL